MKYASFFLAVGMSFLAGGCLVGGGQAHGGSAGSIAAPFIASAAPDGLPDPASADPAADDKPAVGDPTVMSRTLPDPSGGADSPITIVGLPQGITPKPRPHSCDGSGFHLCFQKVSAAYVGSTNEAGRFEYEISGKVLEKHDDGTFVDVAKERIQVVDTLFNTSVGHWITKLGSGDFNFDVIAPVGRGVKLSADYCNHLTQVDFTLPDASSSPVTVDPCSSSDPTDVYTPPSTDDAPEITVGPHSAGDL